MKATTGLLAVAALAVTANAQTRQEVWHKLKQQYDANGDGTIARSEYDRGEDKFARFDRNRDGELTDADFAPRERPGQRGGGQRRNASARRRGNSGGVSQQAMMFAPELAKKADKDRSGSVLIDEWDEFLSSLEVDADGAITAASMPFKASGRMGSFVTRGLDVDGDGTIGREDLQRIYEAADKNEDGELQREEFGPLPIPGEQAPDFDIPYADDKSKTFKLSDRAGKRPVALIFGSYT